MDVAAVGYCLFSPEVSRNQSLARSLGISPQQLQSIFTFSLALHDLGKFTRAFQGLASPGLKGLVGPEATIEYTKRHDTLGMLLWTRGVSEKLGDGHSWHWPASQALGRHGRRAIESLLGAAFGHHGKPVESGSESIDDHALEDDQEAAWEFSLAVAELMKPDWPVEQFNDREWSCQLKRMSWHLAGQAVLADWLGSNQDAFPYQSDAENLDEYWHGKAIPRARALLQQLGFAHALTPAPFEGVEPFFGFEPTPLQLWAQDIPLEASPQLFILEDVTGAGKTEAAMTLAHRLLERHQVEGVYFGLPTMATSNAMYSRIAGVYRRWFAGESQPNLVLAHGARQLNDPFGATIIPSQALDNTYGVGESSASAICNEWFADSRKKALLADVGVGTIDQVLMALLPFRHQSLRLIGLANKLLIVDEIHACDDYMLTLLTAVLTAHAQQGGSAVLLTATLPLDMRHQLVRAWQRGLQGESDASSTDYAFPLATHVSEAGVAAYPVGTRKSVEREVRVDHINDEEAALASLAAAAREGLCACWVRNTVDDAIAAIERLAELVPDPEKLLLFHSRFVMADRQAIEAAALSHFGKASGPEDRAGWVLVATQVVEQSLDLDFDVMISDLAPIDLLIQRAGRLHRHSRDVAGNRLETNDERRGPTLQILAPPYTETPGSQWVRSFLPGTAAVYRNHGQLWLTLKVLLTQGAIRMPQEARLLIESVFSDEAEAAIPEGLFGSHLEQEGARRGQAAMGHFNKLNLDKGYVPASAAGGWLEDVDIGTRLSDEPSVTVTLVRLNEDRSELLPWVTTGQHRWELSQLTVRQSLANRLPAWPAALEVLAEQLFAARKALKYSRLWLPESEEAELRYSQTLGMHKPRECGERN
ncbi:CRISPR-associated helicase Cas3' [Hydrocarboniclastica marina]|uniref:CRISPR-associated helicase Cas3 n=1 Tax=Hydrocarboniclastica marina TaxID=2259620 RepID=A0A4P7XLN9_9ALTE|nr:CRISPR-associated helicase Cas3' [Hydrocarboniclastica marina]